MWYRNVVYVQFSDRNNGVSVDSLIFYIIDKSTLLWKFTEIVYV